MPTMQADNTSLPHGSGYSELEHVFMAASLIAIMAASLLGNIMVCCIIYRRRRLRTRTNAFIVNLAVADLGVVTLCMPISLMTCLFHHWVLGDIICQLNGFFNIVFTQCSLLSLIAIGVEKYYAIVWPLRRLMTTRRTVGLLCWTWFQPVVIAAVPFTGITKFVFKAGSTQCGVAFPQTLPQTIYGVFVSICGYFVPLSVMAYAYFKIFHSSFRSARRVSMTSVTSSNSVLSHKRVAVTVMILIMVFLVCWSPFFIYAIVLTVNHDLSTNQHLLNLGKASYWMAFLCSAANPYIYGARNPKIRKEFNVLMCYVCDCFVSRLKTRGHWRVNSDSRGSWEGAGQGYGRYPWETPAATPIFTPRYKEPNTELCQGKGYLNQMYKGHSEEGENVTDGHRLRIADDSNADEIDMPAAPAIIDMYAAGPLTIQSTSWDINSFKADYDMGSSCLPIRLRRKDAVTHPHELMTFTADSAGNEKRLRTCATNVRELCFQDSSCYDNTLKSVETKRRKVDISNGIIGTKLADCRGSLDCTVFETSHSKDKTLNIPETNHQKHSMLRTALNTSFEKRTSGLYDSVTNGCEQMTPKNTQSGKSATRDARGVRKQYSLKWIESSL